MVAIEDFQKALRAGNFEEAFVSLLSKAVEFSITTWVVSAESDTTESARSGNRLRTRINLLEGEVNNEIDRHFLDNGLSQELQQFHLEQVARGNQIIEKNLESVEKLIQLLATFKQQKFEMTETQLDSLPIVNELLTGTEKQTKVLSKKTAFDCKTTFFSAINTETESETDSFKIKIEDLGETETPAENLTEVAQDSFDRTSLLDLDCAADTSVFQEEEEWTDIFEEFDTPENGEFAAKTDKGSEELNKVESIFQEKLDASTLVEREDEAEWDGWTIEELDQDTPDNITAKPLEFNTEFENDFEEWIESDLESLTYTPELATEGV